MPPLTPASQPYWHVMLMDFLSRWWPGCGKQNHPGRNKALPKHWFCCTTFCEFKARQKGLWINEELFCGWHGIVKHTISTFKVWVSSQPSLCSQRVCGLSLLMEEGTWDPNPSGWYSTPQGSFVRSCWGGWGEGGVYLTQNNLGPLLWQGLWYIYYLFDLKSRDRLHGQESNEFKSVYKKTTNRGANRSTMKVMQLKVVG